MNTGTDWATDQAPCLLVVQPGRQDKHRYVFADLFPFGMVESQPDNGVVVGDVLGHQTPVSKHCALRALLLRAVGPYRQMDSQTCTAAEVKAFADPTALFAK